jgi:predicted 3-demethylubiquinone-9 3-methyltransferase (glyoxalase superfamily)
MLRAIYNVTLRVITETEEDLERAMNGIAHNVNHSESVRWVRDERVSLEDWPKEEVE